MFCIIDICGNGFVNFCQNWEFRLWCLCVETCLYIYIYFYDQVCRGCASGFLHPASPELPHHSHHHDFWHGGWHCRQALHRFCQPQAEPPRRDLPDWQWDRPGKSGQETDTEGDGRGELPLFSFACFCICHRLLSWSFASTETIWLIRDGPLFVLLLITFIYHYSLLRSRLTALVSHVILNSVWFMSFFLLFFFIFFPDRFLYNFISFFFFFKLFHGKMNAELIFHSYLLKINSVLILVKFNFSLIILWEKKMARLLWMHATCSFLFRAVCW